MYMYYRWVFIGKPAGGGVRGLGDGGVVHGRWVPWDMWAAALFIQPYLVVCKVKILAWTIVRWASGLGS